MSSFLVNYAKAISSHNILRKYLFLLRADGCLRYATRRMANFTGVDQMCTMVDQAPAKTVSLYFPKAAYIGKQRNSDIYGLSCGPRYTHGNVTTEATKVAALFRACQMG